MRQESVTILSIALNRSSAESCGSCTRLPRGGGFVPSPFSPIATFAGEVSLIEIIRTLASALGGGHEFATRRSGSCARISVSHRSGYSRHRLERQTYPVGASPHDDAMPSCVIEVQVELYWQIDGIIQPQCSSGRREVSNGAIDRGSIAQDDLADHQNMVPRDASAFDALIWANRRQRPPRRRPIWHGRRWRQDREPARFLTKGHF
jgi:hypothetical protein